MDSPLLLGGSLALPCRIILPLLAACGGLLGGAAQAAEPPYREYGPNLDGRAVARVLEGVLVETIAQAEKAVVSIARIRQPRPASRPAEWPPGFGGGPLPSNRDDPANPAFIPNEFGSGLILKPAHDESQRLILTNYHVVEGGPVTGQPPSADGQRLYVRFADRRGCDASILAADPRSDLAVLQLELDGTTILPHQLPAITMGKPELPRKGQLVMTLGNPYALARDGSVSAGWGMISNIARRPAPPAPLDNGEMPELTVHHFGTLLQIDSRLNLGASGGAVVNLNGEVIGITTALAALEGYEKSAGYAIPFDAATRRVIDDLTRGYEVEYGLLGIGPATIGPVEMQQIPLEHRKTPAGEIQWSAARVGDVARNSPAAVGGVQSEDVILRVNGKPLYSDEDLIRDIGRLRPEEAVTLDLWRPRTREHLQRTVKLGKWPVRNDEEIIATQPRPGRKWRGITIDHATARHKYLIGYEHHYPDAVLVTGLDPVRHEQQKDGLQEGVFLSHVDGRPVRTPAEFQQAVEGLRNRPVPLQTLDGAKIVIPPDGR